MNISAQVLMTESNGRQESLAITKMNFDVRAHGFLAETNITMTFTNPFPRRLIGNFYMTLPENSSITGYALDINGQLRDAVAVEKVRARQVFEEISRQKIDPGLMEWVQGNYFKTRVYPIPANASRTIRITMLSELQYKDDQFIYEFPLKLPQSLKKLSVNIESINHDSKPKNLTGVFKSTEFIESTYGYKLTTSLINVKPNNIKFTVPSDSQNWQMVEIAKDKKVYFAAATLLPKVQESRLAPKSISLVWDASASRESADIKKELNFLKKILDKHQSVNLKVHIIRNKVDESKSFSIVNGNSQELITYLKDQVLDGGTYLSSKLLKSLSKGSDELLIFSDGMANLSYEANPEILHKVNIFAINSSSTIDQNFFRRCMNSQGAIINLKLLNQVDAFALYSSPVNIRKYDHNNSQVHIHPRSSFQDERFPSFAGIMNPDRLNEAVITIKNINDNILTKLGFKTSKAIPGELLRKFYAHKKLKELLIKNQKYEIQMHGKKFHMVTPYTSLIVLDNINQYIRYRIEPPDSLPNMKEEYLKAISKRSPPKKLTTNDNLRDATQNWRQYLRWYQRSFNYPKGFSWSREIYVIPDFLYAGLLEIVSTNNRADLVGGLGDTDSIKESAGGADPNDSNERDPFSEKSIAQDKLAKESKVSITVTPWSSDSEHIESVKSSKTPYKDYLKLKQSFPNSPDFYIDVAEVLHSKGKTDLAARVASNLLELVIDNPTYLRSTAMLYEKFEKFTEALPIHQRLLKERPDEPQALRNYSLCLEKTGDLTAAMLTFKSILEQSFPRFDIKNTVITEMNRLAMKEVGLINQIPFNFTQDPKIDLRVILTWNADNVDLDLYLTEPTGESSYKNKYTTIGGYQEGSFSSYGPETYLLRKAIPGTYNIKIIPRENSSQSIIGAVIAKLDIFVNYGQEDEKQFTSYHKIDPQSPSVKTQLFIDDEKKSLTTKNKPPFYTVTADDSFLHIASYLKAFGVTWSEFQKANSTIDWDSLTPGMQLIIP